MRLLALLAKFWIDHPQLGRSLVKLDRPYGKNWTEKVAYEIGKKLKLPIVRYELATLSEDFPEYKDAIGIVSPDFKESDRDYLPAESLMLQDLGRYPYSFKEETEFIKRNNLGLPPNYQHPIGIKNGSDLWAGYILFDAVIANRDRHGQNWEISLDGEGNKSLAPLFDSGMSLSVPIAGRLESEPDLTPQKYMSTQTSYFGEHHRTLVGKLGLSNPKALCIWLQQLSLITPKTIEDIIDRVPSTHIFEIERGFAKDLVKYNRQDFLELKQELNLM